MGTGESVNACFVPKAVTRPLAKRSFVPIVNIGRAASDPADCVCLCGRVAADLGLFRVGRHIPELGGPSINGIKGIISVSPTEVTKVRVQYFSRVDHHFSGAV